jgi:hypothetical protein
LLSSFIFNINVVISYLETGVFVLEHLTIEKP